MILGDSFPTTCASCHDDWGYRNATLRMTTWSECRWQAADIRCTRWRRQRERVADSSLHRAPPRPTTMRRNKGGAYFLTTTTVVQCMRRSPSSAERIWDAAILFWEGRIGPRRLRGSSTGDGESASDESNCASGAAAGVRALVRQVRERFRQLHDLERVALRVHEHRDLDRR